MINEIINTINQLKVGQTILYPTDTVWGLGCDVFNEEAVKKIYKIKQREDSKALIILVSDLDMLSRYVSVNESINEFFSSNRPTTIIYSETKNLPKYILANDGSVAIRIVKDEFCKQVISQLGNPIVSTSANISGEFTPQIFTEIKETILSDVDYVVNWRQEDLSKSKSSRIIRILDNNQHQIIRA